MDFIEDLREWKRREGIRFLCTIPRELGRVTKLDFRKGKLVAETESGIEFICPKPSEDNP